MHAVILAGISIPIVALPRFARVFSASFQEVQWIITACLLAVTVTIVSAGRIGDLKDHRPVLLGGTALSISLAPPSWLWRD